MTDTDAQPERPAHAILSHGILTGEERWMVATAAYVTARHGINSSHLREPGPALDAPSGPS